MVTKKLCCILFFVVLALPFVQMFSGIFPRTVLHGVENTIERPSFSRKSWFSGHYALDFNAYFTAKIGFRGLMVKILNQIRLEVFNDVSRDSGTQMIVGKDNWLFEQTYTDFLYYNPPMPEEHIVGFSKLLAEVQEKLAERDIQFFFIISPSKAEIYNEKLPDTFPTQPPEKKVPTNRERLIPFLQQQGVHYLDAHDFFIKIKPESEILFAPGGTHWNYYGSFLVCRELIRRFNSETKITLPIPKLESTSYMDPIGTDKDLSLLLNLLWFSAGESSRIPYPNVIVDALDIDKRPDMLVVGDSFSFTLVDSLRTSQIARHIDLLYYNRRMFSYPPTDAVGVTANHLNSEIGPIDSNTLDWTALLANKKMIILETNEILLEHGSWGFLPALFKHLTK